MVDQQATDLDRWREFLRLMQVPWMEPSAEKMEYQDEQVATVLRVSAQPSWMRPGHGNEGYSDRAVGYDGFYFDAQFAADGSFLRLGIYE